MRRLLCVPIIHSEADLGRAGAILAQTSRALAGERRWTRHEAVVDGFWASVATYLRSLDPYQLKVYQDGMAVGGALGRRIVEEAAGRGSKNYQLILELLDKGAELRRTEDPALLLQERENIMSALQPGPGLERPQDAQRYQRQRDRLMAERDRFIAETVAATLKEGEVGVLFIGANHSVPGRLPGDISVDVVKSRETVQAYFDELYRGHDEKRLEELAQHLTAPVRSP